MSETIRQLNMDLARALGVKDFDGVTEVSLTLTPGQLPTVKVHRHLRTADGLQTAVEVLKLRPDRSPA